MLYKYFMAQQYQQHCVASARSPHGENSDLKSVVQITHWTQNTVTSLELFYTYGVTLTWLKW